LSIFLSQLRHHLKQEFQACAILVVSLSKFANLGKALTILHQGLTPLDASLNTEITIFQSHWWSLLIALFRIQGLLELFSLIQVAMNLGLQI